jgi:hypothetical protein
MIHHAQTPFQARCGTDAPNTRTTDNLDSVTCPMCQALAGIAGVPREQAIERLAMVLVMGHGASLWAIDGAIRDMKADADGVDPTVVAEWQRKQVDAEHLLDALGLVAVNRHLVEAVRTTKVRDGGDLLEGPRYEAGPSFYANACAALADSVLGQVKP